MNAPERIWVNETMSGYTAFAFPSTVIPMDAYILDTPEALAKSDTVRALVKAAVEAERERCAKIADECERQNGPLSKKGLPKPYRAGLESGAQAIAAATRAEVPK